MATDHYDDPPDWEELETENLELSESMASKKKSNPKPAPAPVPDKFHQDIAAILSANTLKLLRMFPENPQFRALVLKETGLWIPEDKTVLADIVQWLESTPIKLPSTVVSVQIKIPVLLEEVQVYRANYEFAARGNAICVLTKDLLDSFAQQSENWEHFDDAICDYLARWGRNNIGTMNTTPHPQGIELLDLHRRQQQTVNWDEISASEAAREGLKQCNPDEYYRLEGI